MRISSLPSLGACKDSDDAVREWADRYRAPAGAAPFPADGPEVPC